VFECGGGGLCGMQQRFEGLGVVFFSGKGRDFGVVGCTTQ